MRKTILAASLALSLGGCATTAGVTTVAGLDVTTIQNTAVAVCGFVPTATTVANILAAGSPILTTAEAIAQAICAAVTSPKSARKRGVFPTVAGVPVKGRFLR